MTISSAIARNNNEQFIDVMTSTDDDLSGAYELSVPVKFIEHDRYFDDLGKECAEHMFNESGGEAFSINRDFKIYIWVQDIDGIWQPFGMLECLAEPDIYYHVSGDLHEFAAPSAESEGA